MRVLVVSGASGGHIFPALAFLDALKDRCKDAEAFLVLPKKNILNQITSVNYKLSFISIPTLSARISLKNLIGLLIFLKGTFESLVLFFEFRPDIVVGFGSLASVPLVLFAWLFRVKTLIHEQNVIPGRANELLAKFADRIAISFSKNRPYLNVSQDRLTCTGNPLRKRLKKIEKKEALDFFGFSQQKFTILVMGGSSGSHSINMSFLKAITGLTANLGFQVIHICGQNDFSLLEKRYSALDVDIKLFTFLEDMHYAYSAAELAVCRSGATTVAELIYFALPAIMIPYPYALRHQSSNADVLRELGAAIVINDGDLDNLLSRVLVDLMSNPDRINSMRLGYGGFEKTDAASQLVDEALAFSP